VPLTPSPAGGKLQFVSVRAEISRQQRLDRHWGAYQGTLDARIVAVVGARAAKARSS
jgi:hypothetical protein